jgi:STAS domain
MVVTGFMPVMVINLVHRPAGFQEIPPFVLVDWSQETISPGSLTPYLRENHPEEGCRMPVMRTETATELTLILHGSARVGDAQALAEEFGRTLESPLPLVSLDWKGIDDVDVSFYQLVLALHRSLADRGRHLTVHPLPAGHVVVTTARLLGLPLEHHLTVVGVGS